MSAVPSPAKVLVTGASGFVASWVVRTLIEQGYSVVGTVRSASKGEYIKKAYSKGFEYAIVPDIEKEDAFLEALKGVQGVLHMASPVDLTNTGDPKLVIDPAVKGTVGILKTIAKHAPQVKRVVTTSSVVAVMQPTKGPDYILTENDWNDFAIQHCEENGAAANPGLKYCASKTLAERAAWEYVKEAKVGFELATVLFPYAFGPAIHENPDWTSPNNSAAILSLSVEKEKTGDALKESYTFADVRDVALVHVRALSAAGAAGHRLLMAAGTAGYQDIYDELNALTPPLANIPVGKPGTGAGKITTSVVESEKTKKILGISQYRGLRETARDTVLSARGEKDFRVQA